MFEHNTFRLERIGNHSWVFMSRELGDFVYVYGTTATEKEVGSIIEVGNPYTQTVQILKNIEMALQAVEANLKDIVRTRIYVTDINNW
jgi:enamine deaminase RidA (YjgF/YER057c/UK114 family)